MGSYSGSSDWDDATVASVEAFKPAQQQPAAAPHAAVDDDALDTGSARDRKRLNAIFAFDTTGSMSAWVENVQDKMEYLAAGLLKLLDMEVQFIGVGDHGDGRRMLQLRAPSRDASRLAADVRSLEATDGQDTPEAFECLFKVLGSLDYDVPTVLVLVTDSVPHGLPEFAADDDGCPFGVDWAEELAALKRKLKKVYLVSCATDPRIALAQRRMVGDNGFIRLDNLLRLTNLVMAICMDEVGELDHFMALLEAQRGRARRDEVLALLGRR